MPGQVEGGAAEEGFVIDPRRQGGGGERLPQGRIHAGGGLALRQAGRRDGAGAAGSDPGTDTKHQGQQPAGDSGGRSREGHR